MKYKITTTPKTEEIIIEGIEDTLDMVADMMETKENKPIVVTVENEYNEEICIGYNGLFYSECDYGDARNYAEEMEEDHDGE